MDMITLAMAKAYTDSKGGYYKDSTITFDGNLDGKVTVPLVDGVTYVKVSDVVLTGDDLLGETYAISGNTFVVAEHNIMYNSSFGTTAQICGIYNDDVMQIPLVVSSVACSFSFNGATVVIPSAGTYFVHITMGNDVNGYVSSLSNETIVPIDQKYLPGVKEISLADYGIDIATIVMSGQKISAVSDMGIWAEIDKYKEVVFVATMGETFKITPTVYAFDANGGAMMVGFTLVAINGSENFMEVKIVLVKGDISVVYCVTTTTNLG